MRDLPGPGCGARCGVQLAGQGTRSRNGSAPSVSGMGRAISSGFVRTSCYNRASAADQHNREHWPAAGGLGAGEQFHPSWPAATAVVAHAVADHRCLPTLDSVAI